MLKSLIVFIAFLLFLIGLFFLRLRKTGGLSPESGMIIDALIVSAMELIRIFPVRKEKI